MVKMIKKPQTTIYAIVYCLHRAIDDCCGMLGMSIV